MSRKRSRSRSSYIALRQPEAPRDQIETSFTPLLRRFFREAPQALSVAFADGEGECIDYVSALPPYDAKIAGAQLRTTLNDVLTFARRLGLGRAYAFELQGERRDLVVRALGGGYLLTVIAIGGTTDQNLVDRAEELVVALRTEAALAVPPWDPAVAGFPVEVRAAVGWATAPAGYDLGTGWRAVEVLGRWEERGGLAGGTLQCFLVREPEGAERTLAHDAARGRWLLWDRATPGRD